MSDELDKLAIEMKNMRPSEASRKDGMNAAMAAFDTEFAGDAAAEKKSHPDQGLTAEPRLTGKNTPTWRVQTFGRDAMTNIRKIFDVKPRTLMLGGSCMAAIFASIVYYQADQFGPADNFPANPNITVIAENNPSVPLVTPVIKTPTGDETPVLPPISPVVPKAPTDVENSTEARVTVTITPPPVEKVPVKTAPVASPEINTAASSELPSNVVVIVRRILITPARTQERAIPSVTKTETRRRVKTPASTQERTIPAITKQVTRQVSKGDGTFEIVSETVVVQSASTALVNVPAVYESYTETVVVQEASTELMTVPPVYETVRETIQVGADGSTQVLKSETLPAPKMAEKPKGITSIDSLLAEVESDEIMVTASRTRAGMHRARRASEPAMFAAPDVSSGSGYIADTGVRPAPALTAPVTTAPSPEPRTTDASTHVVERIIPAVTKQVTRRVVKTPASTQERVIPAITKEVTVRVKTEGGTYKDVTTTFVIQEASTELITIPSVYGTVTETIVVQEAYTELVVMNADGTIASRELKAKPPKPKRPKPKPLPQSGRLTAGDYDDVLNPDLYKIYLDKMLQGPLKGKDLPYVDANRRISVRVVDRLGKAVPMADIKLKSAGGKKMFPLRTGADGMAYLYPNFDGLKSGAKIKISVKGAKSVKRTLTEKLIMNGGEIVVDLKTDRQPIESLDLLLTIDATGSMGDEMRYLQSELKAIIDRVEAANPGIDIRIGLVVYRDKGDAYIVREIPFTDDLEDFRRSLGKQTANGGGDTPEAMHMAMQAGLEMDWRKDALKINLLVADAPPHDQYIADTWEAGLMSRSEGIHVVPLAASGVDKTAEFLMRSMAQITGGRFLFLTDDSGVGNPHAEPTVDCYVVTRLDGLVTRVINSMIKGERVEPEADDVIRSVGNYRSGICAIERQEDNVSPQNAVFKDEQ